MVKEHGKQSGNRVSIEVYKDYRRLGTDIICGLFEVPCTVSLQSTTRLW